MGIMDLIKSKKKDVDSLEVGDEAVCSVPQIARSDIHPFKQLDNYVPLSRPEDRLYLALREAVPVIDAAINKIVRLTGGFKVKCADEDAQKHIDRFLANVKVGSVGRGIDAFVDAYLDQLITYGTAIGEIVPNASRNDIAALTNAPLQSIEIIKDENILNFDLGVRSRDKIRRLKYQHLCLLSALRPQPGEVRGDSLLKSLPFVSSTLLKIFNTIGTNFERAGNVRFAVTYKPAGELDKAQAKERALSIAKEWSNVMSSAVVRDFVSVGDVDIKVIGADNQVLDSTMPVRHMLEQIIAVTGIPPFMLGLSWSTTERMSAQQADILTSELEAYRRTLNPVISKICKLWLNLKGFCDEFEICWENISLQDEVELAKAKLMLAQAENIEKGDE